MKVQAGRGGEQCSAEEMGGQGEARMAIWGRVLGMKTLPGEPAPQEAKSGVFFKPLKRTMLRHTPPLDTGGQPPLRRSRCHLATGTSPACEIWLTEASQGPRGRGGAPQARALLPLKRNAFSSRKPSGPPSGGSGLWLWVLTRTPHPLQSSRPP